MAQIIMVLMIILGTLIGSHNTLAGMRKSAALVFTTGARGDGIGIQSDLRERSSAAYNMVVIARKYLPEENSLMQNVLKTRTSLDAASSVKDKALTDRLLETAVRDLHDVLNGMALSEKDAVYAQGQYTAFRSGGDRISHDPYNKVAESFNKSLSGFPAGFLGGLTGVKPLDLYE